MARTPTVNRARVETHDDPTAERVPTNRAVAIGRDGKPIWRRTTTADDQFSIDPALIPDGWTYQWKSEEIVGQSNHSHIASLKNNGWSYVPASRHPGLFQLWDEKDPDKPIRRNGMLLMEQPTPLYNEAVREQKKAADDQVYNAAAQHVPNARVSDVLRNQSFIRRTNEVETFEPEGNYQLDGA